MPPSHAGHRRIRLVAITSILVILSHIVTFVSANCYLPNSTDRNSILWDAHGIDYQPSGFGSSVDDFQMCCATNNRAVPDTPRKDGLCQLGATIWRESCTDPTWKSPSCVKLCVDGISMSSSPHLPAACDSNTNLASHRRPRRTKEGSRQHNHAMFRPILLLRRQEYKLLPTGQWRLDQERRTHNNQPKCHAGHN